MTPSATTQSAPNEKAREEQARQEQAARDYKSTVDDAATQMKARIAELSEQAEELRDQGASSARRLVEMHLSLTEQTTATLTDLYVKAAEATKVDAVASLAQVQADLVRKVTETYASTTRELLKGEPAQREPAQR